VVLTPEEKTFLAAHGPLRFAPHPNRPPIEWFDEDGHYRGLVADYIDLIEARLGVRIDIVRASSWGEVMRLSRAREVDGITAAQRTLERSNYLDFTPVLIDVPNVVIVHAEARDITSLNDLQGRSVAVTAGHATEEDFRARFPGIHVVAMADDASCLTEVSFGRVDAAVVNLAVASYLIERQGITNLRVVADSGRSNELSIATRNDQPLLRSIMTKALAAVTPAEREAIQARWIRIEAGGVVPWPRVLHWIVLLLGALVLAGGLVAVWTRALRREVARATAELQAELAERRRAEAALRRSERKLTLHLEQTIVGVIEFDLDFRVAYWNTAAERIFGWPGEEILHRSAEVLLPSADRAGSREAFQTLRSGSGGWRNVSQNITRDGRTITCEWFNTVLNDDAGGVSGVMSLAFDVSDRERREEAQARAERLESLAVLAGGIAHDFNNLLTVILGNLSLALDDDPPLPERRELLGEATAAARRAQSLTRQLLTFARGGAPLRAVLDVGPIVEEAARFASRGAAAACHVDISPGLWPVNGDAGQLAQVVQNLVLNAIEAHPSGTVQVSASNVPPDGQAPLSLKGPAVRLRVRDHGPGIPSENLSRIFYPFFSTKERGSGLGLAVTHSVVTRHGGHVEVRSTPGEGAAFDVYLPAVVGGRPAVPEPAPLTTARRSQARILVMDDEESLRRLAKRVLSAAGFEVEVTCDGAETVASWRTAKEAGRPFQLAVLDLTVPGAMGGVETLAALRVIDPDVRAVVSSGYSEGLAIADATQGFDAVVPKPWSADEFRRVVAKLVS
jgi:PAS domain S-box-containing protein